MKIFNKKNAKRAFNFTCKSLLKVGLASGGGLTVAGSVVTGNIAGVVAGGSVVASVISSSLKDEPKNAFGILKAVYKIITKLNNILACNIDKANNDPKSNK